MFTWPSLLQNALRQCLICHFGLCASEQQHKITLLSIFQSIQVGCFAPAHKNQAMHAVATLKYVLLLLKATNMCLLWTSFIQANAIEGSFKSEHFLSVCSSITCNHASLMLHWMWQLTVSCVWKFDELRNCWTQKNLAFTTCTADQLCVMSHANWGNCLHCIKSHVCKMRKAAYYMHVCV